MVDRNDGNGIDSIGNGNGTVARGRIGVELKGDGPGFGIVVTKKRVYVGNLSWNTRWQDLKDHMRKTGEVVHAEIFTESFGGRSAGCGIVEYESSSGAENAILSMNDTILDGRQIFVRADREEGRKHPSPNHHHYRHKAGSRYGGSSNNNSDDGGGYRRRKENISGGMNGSHGNGDGNGERGRKIVIWNLPFHMRWQDVKDVCREYGSVIRADVPLRPDGKSKGMGMVLFERKDEAERAITGITGREIDGRIVDCRHDKYA